MRNGIAIKAPDRHRRERYNATRIWQSTYERVKRIATELGCDQVEVIDLAVQLYDQRRVRRAKA